MQGVAVESSSTLGRWSVRSSEDGRLTVSRDDVPWLSGFTVTAAAADEQPSVSLRERDGRLLVEVDGGAEASLRADVEGGRHPINARLDEGEDDVDLVGSRARPYTGDPDAEV